MNKATPGPYLSCNIYFEACS